MGKFLKRYIIIMICFMLYFTGLPAYKFYKLYNVNEDKLAHVNELYEILKNRISEEDYLTNDEIDIIGSATQGMVNYKKESERHLLFLIDSMTYSLYLMGDYLKHGNIEYYDKEKESYYKLEEDLLIMLDYYNNKK